MEVFTVVISAINLREGGALSILHDLINELMYLRKRSERKIKVILLCSSKSLFKLDVSDITVIEYPLSKKSYIIRLYYEYIGFYVMSKKINADVWLSLHDITPNVKARNQYVYCHNPSPFYKLSIRQLYFNWKEFLFALLYKYVYKILIHRNKAIIVQQNWIAEEFSKLFKLPLSKLIVSKPNIEINENNNTVPTDTEVYSKTTRFIYPSLPRSFKNFELLLSAVEYINHSSNIDFQVDITLNGRENRYSRYLYSKFGHVPSVNWVGFVDRDDLLMAYGNYDAMIFCSKLETFGMPIEEFKATGKPIIIPNLPYAHETSFGYPRTMFFDVNSVSCLVERMMEIINKKSTYHENPLSQETNKFKQADTWSKLLESLIDA